MSLATVVSTALRAMGGPSVAVAGVVGDRLIFCEATAGVDVESTAYMTASISKTFVAVACMQCKERGELDLDADISQYTDLEIFNPYFKPKSANFISCRHLLTHSSGLVDDESHLLPGPFRADGVDCPVNHPRTFLNPTPQPRRVSIR